MRHHQSSGRWPIAAVALFAVVTVGIVVGGSRHWKSQLVASNRLPGSAPQIEAGFLSPERSLELQRRRRLDQLGPDHA